MIVKKFRTFWMKTLGVAFCMRVQFRGSRIPPIMADFLFVRGQSCNNVFCLP